MDEHVHAAPFFFHERGGGGDVLVAGHVAGEDKLTAELFGDGFHALVDGFTGIAERQPGALFLKAGSDSVRDASVVGYPEDEALFVFQQHGFLVVGTEWKRGLRRPGKSSPSDGQTGMIRESPFRRRRKGGFQAAKRPVMSGAEIPANGLMASAIRARQAFPPPGFPPAECCGRSAGKLRGGSSR